MSQRTRGHTTAAASKPTKVAPSVKAVKPPVSERPTEPVAPPESIGAAMSPDALARALRAVAAELERDPALARRVATAMGGAALPIPDATQADMRELDERDELTATIGRSFHPTIVTGVAPDLGSGVPDPFALRERLGIEGLREALESLRLGSLRAIVREHKLDPSGALSKLNDAAKLRERIVRAAVKRA